MEFKDTITYKCKENMFFENNEINKNIDSTQIECKDVVGEYDIPLEWPNCTETVLCGLPPDPPFNGTIKWLNGAQVAIMFKVATAASKLLFKKQINSSLQSSC